MRFTPYINNKWRIAREIINPEDSEFDLANFKASPANFKIALWDPNTNGVRLLRTLIFNFVSRMSDKDIARLARIPNRSVGKPIEVRHRGITVCLDYAQAYSELMFIEEVCEVLQGSILEIGGGYGRTCHTILALHNELCRYTILDIPWMLEIADRYLREVLPPDSYAKVELVPLDGFSSLSDREFTLVLNIDGFNEFEEHVVKGYLQYIADHTCWFYTKNPVAKYYDTQLDGGSGSDVAVHEAITSGILKDVINVFDSEEINSKVPQFLDAFCPGPKWRCVRHSGAEPWSFYHQALYKRTVELDRHAAIT